MKIEKKSMAGTEFAAFHVPVGDKTVCMGKRLYQSEEDGYFVVQVDRFRFESVWFKCGCWRAPELARGNEKNWRNARKYQYAEESFGNSPDSPVSLPTLRAPSDFPSVSFINGMTRTVWLMANDAVCFPVLSFSKETANNLHRYIGVKGSPVLSNNDLFAMLDE